MGKDEDKIKDIANGIAVLGIAIFILTAGKIPPEASIVILLFFDGGGLIIAQNPKESKRIAKAVADVIVEIISLFGQIIIGTLKKIRDRVNDD